MAFRRQAFGISSPLSTTCHANASAPFWLPPEPGLSESGKRSANRESSAGRNTIRTPDRRSRTYALSRMPTRSTLVVKRTHRACNDRASRLSYSRVRPLWLLWAAHHVISREIATTSDGILVEAGGIEPPSENRRAMATTRVFRDLISPPRRPRTGSMAASHFEFRYAPK